MEEDILQEEPNCLNGCYVCGGFNCDRHCGPSTVGQASAHCKEEPTVNKNEHRTKLQVFRALCRHNCDIMSSWVPLPATVIAQSLGVSVYQVRKAIKTLVTDGLAVKDHCLLDLEDHYLPYHGYTLTEKARKTGIHRYVALNSARIAAHCFGGSVQSFLPDDFDTRWLHPAERVSKMKEMYDLRALEVD